MSVRVRACVRAFMCACVRAEEGCMCVQVCVCVRVCVVYFMV